MLQDIEYVCRQNGENGLQNIYVDIQKYCNMICKCRLQFFFTFLVRIYRKRYINKKKL